MSDDAASFDGAASLVSISHGAGLFLGGKAVLQAIGFLTNLVLTRTLGTTLYGLYAYLTVLLSLFQVFTRLGGDKSMLRYLPEYESNPRRQRVMVTIAFATSLIASVLVAGIVWSFAPEISRLTLGDPLFVDVLRVGALVLPFNTLANVTYAVFRAIERMEYDVLASSVLQPTLRLVFVGGAVLLGYSVVGAAAGFVVAGALTFLASVVILVRRTDLWQLRRPSGPQVREYYDFSVPLTFNQIGYFLYNRVDLLMVGLLLSSSAVGIYNIAVLVAGLLVLPLTAFNQLFPPIASKLYHGGDRRELQAVYGTVTRWVFTLALFPGLAAMLYAEEVLRVFGSGFTEGALVLVLFSVAQLTNCAVGPSGFVLMMTDHQYLTMGNQLVSGVLNIVLNYVFILQFGFVGAAVATAGVLTSINVLRVVQVWYLEGMFPYDATFLKPVGAGVASAMVMSGLSLVLGGYTLLVIGGALGAASFLGTLFLLGFEQADVDLLRQLRPA